MKKNYRLLIVGLALLMLDQITKYMFFNKQLLEDRQILQPAFNTGISWSIQMPVIIIILIAGLSLYMFILAYKRNFLSWIVFSFLLAGTLGNVIDRISFQGVRDFIYIGSWFPIFNMADIYLNIGVILFLLSEFFPGKRKQKS